MSTARPVAQSLFPDVVQDKPVGYLMPSVITGRNAHLIATVAPFYVKGTVMDATYGLGGWWKRHRPDHLVAHDLDPSKGDGVDFTALPEPDDTYDTVAFDPPYIPTTGNLATTTKPIFRDRFGLIDRTAVEMWQLIAGGLAECTRVLKPGGHLLVKCMDYSNGRQFILGHQRVLDLASELPLITHDLIVHFSGGGSGLRLADVDPAARTPLAQLPDRLPQALPTEEPTMNATTAPRRGKNRPTSKLDIRPARRRRRFKHDTLTATDAFSGFGGMTTGAKKAGAQVIVAANHNPYKTEVHEANNPEADHYLCDLVDTESPAYWNAADLPPAILFMAGISCKHHSQANAEKAYAEGLNLLNYHDPDWEQRVTRSERDRATAICVLQYADAHHPLLMLIECTTELVAWGPQLPGRKNIGDGTTYRWWLNEITKLGYRHRPMYLNSQFFGVPQSRDRIYLCFWDAKLPDPDLEIRPIGHCPRCAQATETVWTWRTRIPPSGRVRYGEQYHYVCPRCSTPVRPAMTPALHALDLSDLGPKLGDRKKPLKPASLARADRCRQRLSGFPLVLIPAKTARGSERHAWDPMATQTSQQETALLSAGAIMKVAGNTYERPGSECRTKGLDEPLWTQSATEETAVLTSIVPYRKGNEPRGLDDVLPTIAAHETTAVLSAGVVPYRQHTIPTTHVEPMPTFTAEQTPALMTAAGFIKHNGDATEAKYRAHPVSAPLGTVTAGATTQAVLFSGWFKQNGSHGDETAPHGLHDPLGTLTGRDTTAMVSAIAALRDELERLPLDEHHYRMLFPWETGRGSGFDPDFREHKGSFIVWGSARDQVDGYGNAVSPAVAEELVKRLVAVL